RMWPPQSVKTCPTPACFSVRATRWPPVRSMHDLPRGSPELLPLDALAIHSLFHECLADPLNRLSAAAHVDDEPVHAMDQALDGVGNLAPLAAPPVGRLTKHR